MKIRFLTFALALVLLVSLLPAIPAMAEETDAAAKYVTLDGDWHFKLYRTYSQMYQYFPYYGGSEAFLKWEDPDAAQLPDRDAYTGWESFPLPYPDYQTGGLLPQTRPGVTPSGEDEEFDPQSVLLPAWSEAWVARTFELPADFTDEDTVTLLFGVVDDNDVIFINGQAVASSGFVDGEGAPVLNTLPAGGFDYAGGVLWERSYWEVEREYTIPTEVLNLGGTNEIAIRLYNNNSFGGFYLGKSYALAGNSLAVRAAKGLPTEIVNDPAYEAVIAAQIAAVESGDLDAYAATIWEDYHNDAADKAARVAELASLAAGYSDLRIEDSGANFYVDDQGRYWYAGTRTITGTAEDGSAATLFAGDIEIRYAEVDGEILEVGNWNRTYTTSYNSALLEREATYSVYLPPSYYTDSAKTYPVVYLLHGQNSSSASFLNVDHIGDFVDGLIEEGTIEELILIMPDSGKNAFYQDSEGGPDDNNGPWRTHITDEIVSLADSTYRTIPDAQHRALTGISMGGYGAVTIGSTTPETFSSVASHMGWLPAEALEALQSLSAEELEAYDFYLDVGLQDTTVGTQGTIDAHDYLESIGKAHGYDLRDGGHNSAFYMGGMAGSLKVHSDHFQGIHVEDG